MSDLSGQATITDPLLINPWGVSFSPTSPFWISNAGSNTATLYMVTGAAGVSKVALNISTPGSPTGQVYNSSTGFVVSQGGGSGAAAFLFAQMNGTISGWNTSVSPPVAPATSSTQAILAATGSPTPAAYTGLALGTMYRHPPLGFFLFAANSATGPHRCV